MYYLINIQLDLWFSKSRVREILLIVYNFSLWKKKGDNGRGKRERAREMERKRKRNVVKIIPLG